MNSLHRRRFLFVTGKGGVGKTTVCAALALALSQRGLRVLVAVTGAKERFSTLFDSAPLGTSISALAPGLSGVVLSAEVAISEYGHLKLGNGMLADAIFENRYVKSFFAGAPGLKEWALLGKAWYHSTELENGRPRFDVVLLDAPATGHGLDMLRVPKVILELSPPGVLRTDAERALATLQDPKQSGAVVVTLPEELPVNETEELVGALRGELALPIGLLVVNGVREELFTPADRAALAALAPKLPFSDEAGSSALAAGIRRAVRERVQVESLARVSQLGLSQLSLPLLAPGAASRASLETLAWRFSESFSDSVGPGDR
jgi:anion-transporting  ArsA/GET3 family ATPase